MFKKLVILSLGSASQIALAANSIDLYQTPLSRLSHYSLIQKTDKQISLRAVSGSLPNQLQMMNQTNAGPKTIVRYQQLYQGIPVVGAQIMITKENKTGLSANKTEPKVNGHLIDEINLKTEPSINPQTAVDLAKKMYLTQHPQSSTSAEESELQIRSLAKDTLQLVYRVSFKSVQSEGIFDWPVFVIDAHNGEIIKQWNNIKTYDDTGPGGNDKVHEYWYGKDDLPALIVTKNGNKCEMDDTVVRLVDLKSREDEEDKLLTSYKYTCGYNRENRVNGAFSPINDAYYFGHVVVDMYKDWFSLPALQTNDGKPMLLIMRVHYGKNVDNAFWDGKTMSFGDGSRYNFYPLVSLDVAGHEVSHGFTEQHSNLEYHDESGALNESFSDMAGLASRAYLLETNPKLYNQSNIVADKITWGIGETIVKDNFGYKALRFMDSPSDDEHSADCLDKTLAQTSGTACQISYSELLTMATKISTDPEEQQSYIVHTASGVFNKAFYLLSEKVGVKKAYHIMLLANSAYWTPTTDFKNAACGALYAANDLNSDVDTLKSVFDQVGIDTKSCSI